MFLVAAAVVYVAATSVAEVPGLVLVADTVVVAVAHSVPWDALLGDVAGELCVVAQHLTPFKL